MGLKTVQTIIIKDILWEENFREGFQNQKQTNRLLCQTMCLIKFYAIQKK